MSLVYETSFENGLFGKYRKVADKLPPGSTILEIGCHTGYFSQALMECGHMVIGVETNPEAVRLAKSRGVNVICEDVESPMALSLVETFDVILLMDILEHLREPVELLRKLRPLLNSHGRIIVTGPNVAFWTVRKEHFLGHWDYADGGILDRTHLHFYTASTWKALIQEGGFAVTSFESATGGMPMVHLLDRVPLLGWLPPFLHAKGMQLFPNLFTSIFLFEAIPVGDSHSQRRE